MKSPLSQFIVFASLTVLFAACQKSMRDQITGTWKIHSMVDQMEQQQKEFSEKQLQMIRDSITASAGDSARQARFQGQLENMESVFSRQKTQRDSMIMNTRWIYQKDGVFEADEMGQKRTGTWSLDEQQKLLFTILDRQTYHVKVRFEDDTMILSLDSLNYMKFVRAE